MLIDVRDLGGWHAAYTKHRESQCYSAMPHGLVEQIERENLTGKGKKDVARGSRGRGGLARNGGGRFTPQGGVQKFQQFM
jgi:hypothetical protein